MEVKLSTKDAAQLGLLFGEAAMFAGTEMQRPILTGVLFHERGDKLALVATDSYALVTFTTHIDAPADMKVNVGAAELAAIGKLLGKMKPRSYGDDGLEVTLAFGERELEVETPTWTQRAPIIDGDYPNYDQLVPVGDGNAEGWPKLSVTYLAKLAKLRCAGPHSATRQSNAFGLVFTMFGPLKPCRVTGTSDFADLLALLMPQRVS